MIRNSYRLLALTLVAGLLTACPSVQEEKRSSKLQETTQAYLSSLRWGYYDLAAQMILNNETAPKPVDYGFLNKIRVTDYDVRSQTGGSDANTASVTVVLSYYHTDYGTVNVITDRQTWRYHEEAKRWLLDGNLPDFKGGLARN